MKKNFKSKLIKSLLLISCTLVVSNCLIVHFGDDRCKCAEHISIERDLKRKDEQLVDTETMLLARDILEEMELNNTGSLILNNSPDEINKAIVYLGYEVFNGGSPVYKYEEQPDGTTELLWDGYEYTVYENDIANKYLDKLYEENYERVESLESIEKIRAIAEIVADNIRYSMKNCYGTIYKVSTDGEGVCTSYVTMMNRLCEKFGIKCRCVLGQYNGDYHIWNKITLDDELYMIADICLYDQGINDSFFVSNRTYEKMYVEDDIETSDTTWGTFTIGDEYQ